VICHNLPAHSVDELAEEGGAVGLRVAAGVVLLAEEM